MANIQVSNLTKRFGETLALDNISLALGEQKIYGLLGRNGAGKTTLLNLMTSKIFPTKGEIRVDGHLIQENDKILGTMFYMAEQNLYPSTLRVKGVFKWTKRFYPEFASDYAKLLADRFRLDTKKKVKELSTGYGSIFKAIMALASNAQILLFDEPVLGLDANHRDLLYKEILANYIAQPKTVVLSTHLIEEVAEILEEVIILKEGQIMLKQSVEELLASAHTVTGEIAKVDQYAQSKKCVGAETLGNLKSVTVLNSGRDHSLAKSLNLELGVAELQKLFIGLTNS